MTPESQDRPSWVLHRDLHRRYPVITHGSGINLYDDAGKCYLDGSSGALVANLGHGRHDMAAAMAEQAGQVAYAHTLTFTTPALEELAREVSTLVGDSVPWYTYPTSGGSEAVETAVKLVRHIALLRGATGRHRILSFRPSYHGNSLGALAVSGDPVRQAPYRPLLGPAFVHAPPISENCSGIGADGSCPCLIAVEDTLREYGADTFAAVILEPVSGSARSGFTPHEGFVASLTRLAHRNGLLVVADEVMTGFGRTGKLLAMDHHGVRPDLFTAAKGLSGGYAPMGAVIVSGALYQELLGGPGSFLNGFTYSGNPVSARVAAKALQIVRDENLVARSADMGSRLHQGLLELAARHPVIRRVRGRGLMQGIVLEQISGIAARVVESAFEHGLILYHGHGAAEGGDGEHVLIGPPLIIDVDGIHRLLDLLDQALGSIR